MKIVSFSTSGGSTHTGALLEGSGEVLDFQSPACGLPQGSGLDWFDLAGPCLAPARALWGEVAGDARRLDRLRSEGAVVARTSVRLLAPVPQPRKVVCIGLNYRDHAAETGVALPERPLLFSKFPSAVIGPGAAVQLPAGSTRSDYEAELCAVIGRKASRVSARDAYGYVLGYTNFNDVTERAWQRGDGQWQRGKSPDTFAPLGEYIATTDEIPDPQRLTIRLRLNGKTMQDSSTSQLVFAVPELIAFISAAITLMPGDLIATGTPPGVGFARRPPVYLKDGDVMEVEIEGLGVLRNPVVGG